MSLRENWYAARSQRQQEVRERQQEVLEHRQEIQAEMAALHEYQRTTLTQFCQNLTDQTTEFLANTTANRAAMAAAQSEALNNFHNILQADVAAFREAVREHHQQVSLEQAHQRAAFVAALQDYVWGTTPTPVHGSSGISVSPPAPATTTPNSVSDNLERVFQYLQQNSGTPLNRIQTALGLSRTDTVDALQSLINQKLVMRKDRGYFVMQES